MRPRCITGLIGAAAVSIWAAPGAPLPHAYADPCTDAEVIFARGTDEAPGVGPVGQALVDSVRSRVGPKSVGVYAVDYPATTKFSTAIEGIADARAHILSTAANCPNTKMVLGGFSQGAAVMGFVTADAVPDGISPDDVPAPLPPAIADHIAAVALFGKPSTRFMRVIRDPPVTIGPQYLDRTIDLCIDNDLVCDAHGSSFAVHNTYEESGMVDQGASFVANLLQSSWAAADAAAAAAAAAASHSPDSPSDHLPSDGVIVLGPPAPVVPAEPIRG